ncbi:MAG: hypothetical protein NT018_00330 [Armatimonadetes bacterium]|nr:hypothetical protein [Armatimonadota bacterium]
MIKTSKICKIIIGCAVICALPSLVLAYPTAVSVIPSTDVIGANNLKLAYESNGNDQPFDTDNAEYFYTQYGIGEKFELGVDVYDLGGHDKKYLNAKYMISAESETMPAISVGAMYIGDGNAPLFYAVGSRSFGAARLFVGAQTWDDNDSMLLGASYKINEAFSAAADYQSSAWGRSTLGLTWHATTELSATLYGSRNNDRTLDAGDYIGLVIGYKVGL